MVLKNSDNTVFDAQWAAESKKIVSVKLQSVIFEQYRLFHQWVGVKLAWKKKHFSIFKITSYLHVPITSKTNKATEYVLHSDCREFKTVLESHVVCSNLKS